MLKCSTYTEKDNGCGVKCCFDCDKKQYCEFPCPNIDERNTEEDILANCINCVKE